MGLSRVGAPAPGASVRAGGGGDALRQGTQCAPRTQAALLHPAGSWDALGVHFQSSDGSGTWADKDIIELVKKHNARA